MSEHETPEQAKRRIQENQFWIDQLGYRRQRIETLIPLQKNHMAAELLRAELNYVNTFIEFRQRFQMKEIVMEKPA